MCDNKNELHKSEYDKSKDNTSIRLDLDITESTDSYPEFDFLDLLRNLQIKDKKLKHKSNSEESANKSNLYSEEDSDVEALAKLYEEKYGNCNDYAELGEGYDEEDSFIDNTDAVNDLVPTGIQTEFGGFYINRGKLNFIREDNSSSSTSEDVDKFLAHNRLNARKIISDDESEDKESCKSQSNNHNNCNIINNYKISSSTSNSKVNNNNNNNNNDNDNDNNNGSYNNSMPNNSNGNLQSNVIRSRKRSGEFQHKSKKIRKTATPKIPDHLIHKKPFPGSLEFRKNINEFKKNKLKSVETDKKSTVTNLISNNSGEEDFPSSNHSNNIGTLNSGNNNNNGNDNDNNSEDENDNDKKETSVSKKKSTVREKDGATEVIDAVATGANLADKQSSSSSESSESSSSDSDSDSSEDVTVEKEKTLQKNIPGVPPKNSAVNGSISQDITARSFAHLSESLKELIAKISEISKEEKSKFFNSKLNSLLLSLDERLRELPMAERNSVLDHIAEILQMKKDNITKRTKKLLVLQEEAKMSGPLRKLKEAIASMMPHLESNYFNEYTKAAGTSPQIYAELSRYYWSIDSGSLPKKKFPWNDDLRHYLREIVQYRKNCYYIIRPRKESLVDYIRSFMETKVKTFWPKEWMSVDILLEEAQVTSSRVAEDKQKAITKALGVQNSTTIVQKKTSPTIPSQNTSNKKQPVSSSSAPSATSANRKPAQGPSKNPEVKSILIPRKTPQGNSTNNTAAKSNLPAPSVSSLPNSQSGSRLQVTLNRLHVQEYLDRISGSQTSISRNSNQQISPNRPQQQSVSPNRLVKTSNSVLNSNPTRPNASRNTSPNNLSKNISSIRNCNNSQQSVLKTIEIHSNPVSGSKSSPGSVTISPVSESAFRDMSPASEVLNLTKNSSVYISKVKDSAESKTGRSSSPSIGIPLPSGITISPTNASPSNFLSKPQKVPDRNSDVKINVSITKQESMLNVAKEKRESVLNINVKREGPLQNIPDCISVTSKVVQNERPKYEHVRKRALQEYHQQHSPERLRSEEKKIKTEENLLSDIEIKEEKLDDKNFSKIFDSVIAKTSETVRQTESATTIVKTDRYGSHSMDSAMSGGSVLVKQPAMSVSQFKNNPAKLREVRTSQDKSYYLTKSETGVTTTDDRKHEELDERSENIKEQRVQMEMDRVMQNLVELSRENNSEYELEPLHVGYSPSASPGIKSSSFQEAFQKMLFK